MATQPPRGLAIRLLRRGDGAAMISALSALDGYTAPDAEGAAVFLDDARNILLIAQLEGRAVGVLIAHLLPRADGDRMLLIYDLGVEEAYRRRGIGAGLIHEAETIAREADAASMWLVTNRSNEPAMALYASIGGVPDAEDDVVMRWRFIPRRSER